MFPAFWASSLQFPLIADAERIGGIDGQYIDNGRCNTNTALSQRGKPLCREGFC